MFLGTPHGGSDLAPFCAAVTELSRIVRARTNSKLLQLLQRDSETLADIEDSFATFLRKNPGRFRITCFYEELELPAVGMVRVSHSIAQVGAWLNCD